MDLLPCPCGQNCGLSYQARGSQWRIIAYPCGTEGPMRGNIVVTEKEAARAWNEWVVGVETMAATQSES